MNVVLNDYYSEIVNKVVDIGMADSAEEFVRQSINNLIKDLEIDEIMSVHNAIENEKSSNINNKYYSAKYVFAEAGI